MYTIVNKIDIPVSYYYIIWHISIPNTRCSAGMHVVSL